MLGIISEPRFIDMNPSVVPLTPKKLGLREKTPLGLLSSQGLKIYTSLSRP